MNRLYADINGITRPLTINVNTSHSASTATAIVSCINTTLDVGDAVEIDLGYSDNHAKVFTGYVKAVERKVPDNVYTLTMQDELVRAVDYFVASTNPNSPLKYRNIDAEDLVGNVLALAGLTDYDYDPTSFTFAINTDAEVNLVGCYDYCKMISDYLAWHLWADENGTINFKNRKPYVMGADPGEPYWTTDVAFDKIYDHQILQFSYDRTERDLRNRIVVYGNKNIYAEAKQATSYDPEDGTYKQILPTDFYKTVVAASPIIDIQSAADTAATYNLRQLNRVGLSLSVNILGDPAYLARKVIEVQEDILGINGNWYIYAANHEWNKEGYRTQLELRK